MTINTLKVEKNRIMGSLFNLHKSNVHFYSTKMSDNAKSLDRREERYIHAGKKKMLLMNILIKS